MSYIISIEGTDCSGKGTQSQILADKINQRGKAVLLSFPDYTSPTGKIIGGAYLGKAHIGQPLFSEGATNVDAKVASLLYAADRRYNVDKILKPLENGYNVILNRYVESNMGHQASKCKTAEERDEMLSFLETLEYDLLKLPRPDLTIFLYMPYEQSLILKSGREEKPDQHELDGEYLKKSEETYLHIAEKFGYEKIDCYENGRILTREEISSKIWQVVTEKFPDINE